MGPGGQGARCEDALVLSMLLFLESEDPWRTVVAEDLSYQRFSWGIASRCLCVATSLFSLPPKELASTPYHPRTSSQELTIIKCVSSLL